MYASSNTFYCVENARVGIYVRVMFPTMSCFRLCHVEQNTTSALFPFSYLYVFAFV